MTVATIRAPTLNDIRAAASLLAPYIVRTPLLRLNASGSTNEIYLKLESLQPTGAFKVRCMGNAMFALDKHALRHGVYTASSGNAGLGLAWAADKLGVPARVYVPAGAPERKLEAMRQLGAQVQPLSFDDWWEIIVNCRHPADSGYYVDAVRSLPAMAGNGTIGLEIAEEMSDVDTIIIPFGGGGVSCGIASAMRALKPDVRIIVAESDTAAPLTAALNAGKPVPGKVEPSFISGAGAPVVLQEMWPLVKELVDCTIVVPVSEVVDAVRLLLEQNHVVVEGAGALAVAAALSAGCATGKTVCVVTGGNIDHKVLCDILSQQSV